MAGFVFGLLGRAAEPGDEVSHDGLRFRVDSVEGQRIDRLVVTFQPWHRHGGEGDEPADDA
jgi:CBS domain containing-hemolysin-like protein